jgi:uncharacterized protein (TIGR03545 family)
MTRNFQWQTLVPRLLLVVVVLLAAQYGLGRHVRSVAVRSSTTVAGSPLDIQHARVGLLDRQVVLSDLRLASPHATAENLIEADHAVLDVASRPLLYKQAVIDRGTVSGLRFGTATSSENRKSAESKLLVNDAADQRIKDWLRRLDEKFGKNWARQFKSVQLADELCAEWPDRSTVLERRVRELSRRAAELQQLADAAQKNPLRHEDRLHALPDQVAELRNDITQVDAELENMLATLDADRRAIVAARQDDAQFLRERLQIERADASALTSYLLQDEVARPLDEMLGWLRWTRTLAPAEPAPRRAPRGEDILFAGCRSAPTLLIRALELQGTSRLGGGEPLELRGMLTDFTTTPSAHDKPIRLRMKSSGSQSIELQAIIDRTGSVPRDELIVTGKRVLLPKLELGQREQLSLTLAPSEASLSGHLVINGDALVGEIQLLQRRVQAAPALHGNLRNVPLGATLGETLQKADGLTLRIAVGGTLAEPKCTLWSSIGPAVAEAMELALLRAANDRAQQLLAQAQRQVDERLAALERTATQQHSALTAQISGAASELGKIAVQQWAPRRLSHEQLGRRLPANSLFR